MSLTEQTNTNGSASFGYNPNESLNQSVFLPVSCNITTFVVTFDTINIDTQFDVKVRVELRNAFGPDNLLDINSGIIANSSWIDDSALITTQAFALNVSGLAAGHYWFSVVSNQINRQGAFELAWQNNSSFLTKFIKLEDGTGIYRSDTSLKYTVNGSWLSVPSKYEMHQFSEYVISTIRDEQ